MLVHNANSNTKDDLPTGALGRNVQTRNPLLHNVVYNTPPQDSKSRNLIIEDVKWPHGHRENLLRRNIKRLPLQRQKVLRQTVQRRNVIHDSSKEESKRKARRRAWYLYKNYSEPQATQVSSQHKYSNGQDENINTNGAQCDVPRTKKYNADALHDYIADHVVCHISKCSNVIYFVRRYSYALVDDTINRA